MGPRTGHKYRQPSGTSGMAWVPVATMRGVASVLVTALRSLFATGTPQRLTTRERTLAWPGSPSWMIRCWPTNMVASSSVCRAGVTSRSSLTSSTVVTMRSGQDCSTVISRPASRGVRTSMPSRSARSLSLAVWSLSAWAA